MLLRSSEKRWSKSRKTWKIRAHTSQPRLSSTLLSPKRYTPLLSDHETVHEGRNLKGEEITECPSTIKADYPTLACNYRFKKVNRAEKRLVGEKNGYFRNRWREGRECAAYDHRFLRFLVKCFPCIADGNRWTRDSTRLDPDRPRAEQFISAVAAHAKWRRHE